MQLYCLRLLRSLVLASFCISISIHAETVYTPYLITSVATTNTVLFFNTPYDVAADSAGNLYVAATYDFTIWKLTRNGTNLTFNAAILAGASGVAGFQDGPGNQARFEYPEALTVDSNGVVYVADSSNSAIRRIDTNGNVTTLAQSPDVLDPVGITIDTNGVVYFSDLNAGLGVIGDGGGVSRLGSIVFAGWGGRDD